MQEAFDERIWDLMADSIGQPNEALLHLIESYEYHVGLSKDPPGRLSADLATPAFQTLFRKFGSELKSFQRENVCQTFKKQIGLSSDLWCVDDSFTASRAMLALAYHWTKNGRTDFRVKEIADHLEALGRTINNPALVVAEWSEQKRAADKPLVMIVEKAAGQRSALIRLTPEGIDEGKQLWEQVSRRLKA